jgi:hypothetical protein
MWTDTGYRLVASDRAYVAATPYLGAKSDCRLSIEPIPGEPIDFVWDIARHILRTTAIDYQTGSHRDNHLHRDLLFAIFQRISFDTLSPVFAEGSGPRQTDQILILRQDFFGQDYQGLPAPLVGDVAKAELQAAFLLGASHNSPYWRARAGEIRRRVPPLLERLNWERVPGIQEILIARRSRSYSQYVFPEMADRIRMVPEARIHNDLRQMHASLGVRYHNDVLSAAIRNGEAAGRVNLLLISGKS